MAGLSYYRRKSTIVQAKIADSDGFINTSTGVCHFRKGDYLVVGVIGERYAVRKDIFESTYTLAEVTDGEVV